jgi:hypothetical protein
MTHILDGHVKTAHIEWKPLVEGGVDTSGISVKVLRTDPVTVARRVSCSVSSLVPCTPITTIQREKNSSCCLEVV